MYFQYCTTTQILLRAAIFLGSLSITGDRMHTNSKSDYLTYCFIALFFILVTAFHTRSSPSSYYGTKEELLLKTSLEIN